MHQPHSSIQCLLYRCTIYVPATQQHIVSAVSMHYNVPATQQHTVSIVSMHYICTSHTAAYSVYCIDALYMYQPHSSIQCLLYRCTIYVPATQLAYSVCCIDALWICTSHHSSIQCLLYRCTIYVPATQQHTVSTVSMHYNMHQPHSSI